jgi:hypothetical protein
MVLAAVVAGATTGEYRFRRRKLSNIEFSMWRERRLIYVGLLTATWYFLPGLLQRGNSLAASLFDH